MNVQQKNCVLYKMWFMCTTNGCRLIGGHGFGSSNLKAGFELRSLNRSFHGSSSSRRAVPVPLFTN